MSDRGRQKIGRSIGTASNPVCMTDRCRDTWIDLQAKEERENEGE